MHGAEFLLGLVLIGLDWMPVLASLAVIFGLMAAWLLHEKNNSDK